MLRTQSGVKRWPLAVGARLLLALSCWVCGLSGGAWAIDMDFSIHTRVHQGGGVIEEGRLPDRGELRSGDRLQVRIRTDSDAYVYIVTYGSSNRAFLLHPFNRSADDALTRGGRERSVPGPGIFLPLDDTVGKETVFAIAASEPIADISTLLAAMDAQRGDISRIRAMLARRYSAVDVISFQHMARTRVAAPLVRAEPSIDVDPVSPQPSAAVVSAPPRSRPEPRVAPTAVQAEPLVDVAPPPRQREPAVQAAAPVAVADAEPPLPATRVSGRQGSEVQLAEPVAAIGPELEPERGQIAARQQESAPPAAQTVESSALLVRPPVIVEDAESAGSSSIDAQPIHPLTPLREEPETLVEEESLMGGSRPQGITEQQARPLFDDANGDVLSAQGSRIRAILGLAPEPRDPPANTEVTREIRAQVSTDPTEAPELPTPRLSSPTVQPSPTRPNEPIADIDSSDELSLGQRLGRMFTFGDAEPEADAQAADSRSGPAGAALESEISGAVREGRDDEAPARVFALKTDSMQGAGLHADSTTEAEAADAETGAEPAEPVVALLQGPPDTEIEAYDQARLGRVDAAKPVKRAAPVVTETSVELVGVTERPLQNEAPAGLFAVEPVEQEAATAPATDEEPVEEEPTGGLFSALGSLFGEPDETTMAHAETGDRPEPESEADDLPPTAAQGVEPAVVVVPMIADTSVELIGDTSSLETQPEERDALVEAEPTPADSGAPPQEESGGFISALGSLFVSRPDQSVDEGQTESAGRSVGTTADVATVEEQGPVLSPVADASTSDETIPETQPGDSAVTAQLPADDESAQEKSGGGISALGTLFTSRPDESVDDGQAESTAGWEEASADVATAEEQGLMQSPVVDASVDDEAVPETQVENSAVTEQVAVDDELTQEESESGGLLADLGKLIAASNPPPEPEQSTDSGADETVDRAEIGSGSVVETARESTVSAQVQPADSSGVPTGVGDTDTDTPPEPESGGFLSALSSVFGSQESDAEPSSVTTVAPVQEPATPGIRVVENVSVETGAAAASTPTQPEEEKSTKPRTRIGSLFGALGDLLSGTGESEIAETEPVEQPASRPAVEPAAPIIQRAPFVETDEQERAGRVVLTQDITSDGPRPSGRGVAPSQGAGKPTTENVLGEVGSTIDDLLGPAEQPASDELKRTAAVDLKQPAASALETAGELPASPVAEEPPQSSPAAVSVFAAAPPVPTALPAPTIATDLAESVALEPLLPIDVSDDVIARAVVFVVTPEGNGAGIVVDELGHILTNWHLVSGHSSVTVIFKSASSPVPDMENVFSARVIRTSKFSDLALLQVEDMPADIIPLGLAPDGAYQKGQPVHTIGYHAATWAYSGAVVTKVKERHSWFTGRNVVHQAPILLSRLALNLGVEGGPLLDSSNRLVGINATRGRGKNRAYAISVAAIRNFLSPDSAALPLPAPPPLPAGS